MVEDCLATAQGCNCTFPTARHCLFIDFISSLPFSLHSFPKQASQFLHHGTPNGAQALQYLLLSRHRYDRWYAVSDVLSNFFSDEKRSLTELKLWVRYLVNERYSGDNAIYHIL